jgi:hypothetical protein
MKAFRIALLCLLVSASYALHAQRKSAPNANRSARAFVRNFYRWYVPKALGHRSTPAWNAALEAKESSFSPELRTKLLEDSAAQAKADGEIVGLDFDPFLNAQDFGSHYKITRTTHKADRYWVYVESSSSPGSSATSSVIAEVMQQHGQWRFVNFRYAKDHDLLGILDALRRSREGHVPQG